MKKAVMGFLAMVLLLFAGTTSAFAAGSRWGQNLDNEACAAVCSYAGTGCHHGDRDGDGICDFAGTTCFYTHINRMTASTGSITSSDSVTMVTATVNDNAAIGTGEEAAASGSADADTAEAASTPVYANTPAGNRVACPNIGCDGICGNNGAACIDADGNGICDYYDARMQQQITTSWGHHGGGHHGGGHHRRACW